MKRTIRQILKDFLLCSIFLFTANNALADVSASAKPTSIKKAIFAGGCFWCMQKPYDLLKNKGVISAIVGYSGGQSVNPTYEQVSAGNTGHIEVIQITYDEQKIGFKDLLDVFWINVDPFDSKGQFCDKGDHYISAIFYSNEDEKKSIEASIKKLKDQGLKTESFATKVLPAKTFYPAEDYHQSYYEKNPIRYSYYRQRCGRDARLKEVWGSRVEKK